jgi:hypothetical protein
MLPCFFEHSGTTVFIKAMHASDFADCCYCLVQMTVTWTSGYDINEATPFVEWAPEGKTPVQSPAGTLTFVRNSMCGMVYFICLAWHHIGLLIIAYIV